MTCNRSELVVQHHVGYSEVTLYMNNNEANDFVSLVFGGDVTGGYLYQWLKERYGVAVLSAEAGLLLAAALSAYATWIAVENNGCGVKVSGYIAPAPGAWSGVVVSSQ